MRKRLAAPFLVFMILCAQASPTGAQEPPTPAATPPAQEEAMAWDRDFDLLLELKAAPTKAQVEAEERRASLEKERSELIEHLEDLRSRLSAIEGTYTSETLLNEMLRQGVGDTQAAKDNLGKWIRQDEERLKEVEATLLKMAARSRR